MSRKRSLDLCALIFKPFLVCLLIAGVFALVYTRSGVMKLEYRLADLEKKKALCLRERNMLFAEKTSLLSFAKMETDAGNEDSYILPDRVRVIYVDRNKKTLSRKVSLERIMN
jgi:hypothetical protein